MFMWGSPQLVILHVGALQPSVLLLMKMVYTASACFFGAGSQSNVDGLCGAISTSHVNGSFVRATKVLQG